MLPTREYLENVPVIDLGDILLRPIEDKDYKDMFEYGSDKKVTDMLTWHYDKVEEAEKSIYKVHISRPERMLPITYAIHHKEDNKMIGTCDFHSIDWEKKTGEIGYALNSKYWRKGYMTKACKAVMKFGFEYLSLDKIVISHWINNIGSKRVIEKSGFTFLEEKVHVKSGKTNLFYELKKEDFNE